MSDTDYLTLDYLIALRLQEREEERKLQEYLAKRDSEIRRTEEFWKAMCASLSVQEDEVKEVIYVGSSDEE